MRDINRIKRVTDLLEIYWNNYPDLRFFQLVEKLKIDIDKGNDLFYFEDDNLLKELKCKISV